MYHYNNIAWVKHFHNKLPLNNIIIIIIENVLVAEVITLLKSLLKSSQAFANDSQNHHHCITYYSSFKIDTNKVLNCILIDYNNEDLEILAIQQSVLIIKIIYCTDRKSEMANTTVFPFSRNPLMWNNPNVQFWKK